MQLVRVISVVIFGPLWETQSLITFVVRTAVREYKTIGYYKTIEMLRVCCGNDMFLYRAECTQ